MALPTLINTRSPLAEPSAQRARLEALPLARTFESALGAAGHQPLTRVTARVLQVNLGKRCNQACHHCHVDAGPDRTEVMPDEVVDEMLAVLAQSDIATLDITGGAPELHPRFRDIVVRARDMGRQVIDRCNLTITTLPNYADLPEFLAEHKVEVVASLPSYAASQTDRQRGEGVFDASLQALRHFNALGYGRPGTGLVLNLVTNPVGAFLPANQAALERDWTRELKRRYDITFNRLFTITNMPISRYLEWLEHSGNVAGYMEKLVQAFNPGDGERPDVPRHHLRGLGRTPVRLRFQPDAGSAGRSTRAADDHGPSYDSGPLVARRGHRPALLRLHRRRRIQLWRIDHGLKARL